MNGSMRQRGIAWESGVSLGADPFNGKQCYAMKTVRTSAGPDAVIGLGMGSIEHRRPVVVSRYDTRHVDIYRSARKHGVADADILHAVEHALGAIERDDGTEIVIHAMRMRRLYEPLLREMRGTDD